MSGESAQSKWPKLNKAAYEFMVGQAHNLTMDNGSNLGRGNRLFNHGNGHGIGGINGSTSGFILFAVIILLLITMYLACKVYKDKKYYSKEWKEWYKKNRNDDENG